jgi:hypothetical protein
MWLRASRGAILLRSATERVLTANWSPLETPRSPLSRTARRSGIKRFLPTRILILHPSTFFPALCLYQLLPSVQLPYISSDETSKDVSAKRENINCFIVIIWSMADIPQVFFSTFNTTDTVQTAIDRLNASIDSVENIRAEPGSTVMSLITAFRSTIRDLEDAHSRNTTERLYASEVTTLNDAIPGWRTTYSQSSRGR